MSRNKNTQVAQVIEAMRSIGGRVFLGDLYKILDFSTWETETPEATVRRIVQESKEFVRIDRGVWALKEYRDIVSQKIVPQGCNGDEQSITSEHSLYQGMIVEIGNMYGEETFVPSSDRNKMCLSKRLKDIITLEYMHNFTHENVLDKAKNVDVVWFNEEKFPSAFCEVEHTTNFKNALYKFLSLQVFHVPFYIIAKENKRKRFDALLDEQVFKPLRGRVAFRNYDNVVSQHEKMSALAIIDTIKPGFHRGQQ